MNELNTMADIRQYIEKLNREMDECLMRGDLQGYADFYSDEATIIGFEKRKIQGREAINEFCFAMTGVKEAKAIVLDVWMSGDFICQVATSFAKWERNGEEGSYFCDCMYVWRKEADNTYRIFLDAYN
jgi:ketosteroid isomerase-like protein